MAIIRKATFEERNDEGGMPPPNPPQSPPVSNRQDDGDFTPGEHPWNDYSDQQARVHIADLLLQPDDDKLKELTFMPAGIVFEMVLGDSMVAMMENYHVKDFNLAKYLLRTVDKRLRGLDGKMVKYGVLLAGDERKDDEINPANGPVL